jgi:hypothetical protein
LKYKDKKENNHVEDRFKYDLLEAYLLLLFL